VNRVLVGVEFDDPSRRVVEEGCRIASRFDAEVVLVHVALPEPEFVGYAADPQYVRDDVIRELHEERVAMDQEVARVRELGLAVSSVVTRGPTAETLVDEAARRGVDLIVVGSHGKGPMARMVLGSVSEGVLRRAECMVLVVPHRRR
jgi:nucleotide-binding universal stress UspA family protein